MILKGRIPFVYIIKELKSPLFFVTFISIVCGILPHYFGSFLSDIPISIATTLGVAISILLSYKINQSYDRWWEARKIWGEIVNDSRTLVLQLKMYVTDNSSEVKSLSYLQIAWCYCLGKWLRKEDSKDELRKWISAINFEQLKTQKNYPLGILSIQTRSIRQLYLNNQLDRFSQIRIEETLERLTTSMGKCERIKNTVFPPLYKYGLHATIYLFVVFLALSVSFRLQHIVLEMAILVIVSMVFFFLEKAAFRMQDPFENVPTDTPMTSISRKIESNILELLGEIHVDKPVKSGKFYVL